MRPRGTRDGSVAPSRGDGLNAGQQRIDTPIGPIITRKLPDGRDSVTFTSAEQQENAREFAGLSKMTLGEFMKEQLEAARERVSGESGGWIQGEGSSYR